jgi:hypothetical protein
MFGQRDAGPGEAAYIHPSPSPARRLDPVDLVAADCPGISRYTVFEFQILKLLRARRGMVNLDPSYR